MIPRPHSLTHSLTHSNSSDDEIYETWCALEDALSANQTRAIGISNFNETHLDHLAAHEPTVWPPAVNQVEMSVSFHDDAQIAATLQVGEGRVEVRD